MGVKTDEMNRREEKPFVPAVEKRHLNIGGWKRKEQSGIQATFYPETHVDDLSMQFAYIIQKVRQFLLLPSLSDKNGKANN